MPTRELIALLPNPYKREILLTINSFDISDRNDYGIVSVISHLPVRNIMYNEISAILTDYQSYNGNVIFNRNK